MIFFIEKLLKHELELLFPKQAEMFVLKLGEKSNPYRVQDLLFMCYNLNHSGTTTTRRLTNSHIIDREREREKSTTVTKTLEGNAAHKKTNLERKFLY